MSETKDQAGLDELRETIPPELSEKLQGLGFTVLDAEHDDEPSAEQIVTFVEGLPKKTRDLADALILADEPSLMRRSFAHALREAIDLDEGSK